MSSSHPTNIVLHRALHALEVSFDSGETLRLPCEYLRVESPSAEVHGHGSWQKVPSPHCPRDAPNRAAPRSPFTPTPNAVPG